MTLNEIFRAMGNNPLEVQHAMKQIKRQNQLDALKPKPKRDPVPLDLNQPPDPEPSPNLKVLPFRKPAQK